MTEDKEMGVTIEHVPLALCHLDMHILYIKHHLQMLLTLGFSIIWVRMSWLLLTDAATVLVLCHLNEHVLHVIN